MRYDLNNYRELIGKQIKAWKAAKPHLLLRDQLGALAIYTSAPIVVIAYLVGEIEGFDEDLDSKIKGLESFYRVEKVEGKIE